MSGMGSTVCAQLSRGAHQITRYPDPALPTQVGIHGGRAQTPAALDPDMGQEGGSVGIVSAIDPRIKFETTLRHEQLRFERTKSRVRNVCF